MLDQIEASPAEDALRHLPKTAMSEAITHTRNQWSKPGAGVEHARVRIDNNLTEQAIRPTKPGAKNRLFIGHPDAGWRAAIIYTIPECCRRHQVEPLAYLNDMLRRLPGMTNHEVEKANLTPRNWKPTAGSSITSATRQNGRLRCKDYDGWPSRVPHWHGRRARPCA